MLQIPVGAVVGEAVGTIVGVTVGAAVGDVVGGAKVNHRCFCNKQWDFCAGIP